MKDIKHIRRDFHSVAWVPGDGTYWYRGGWGGGVKKNPRNLISLVCLLTSMAHATALFLGPRGLGEGLKGQISLNLYHRVKFKKFYKQTLCVFLQIKD